VKVAAYAYADGGGPIPDELVLLWSIDRYGVDAIFGRSLSFQEVRSMTLADNVYSAYKERARSENWAEWASTHPTKARLLAEVGLLYDELDDE